MKKVKKELTSRRSYEDVARRALAAVSVEINGGTAVNPDVTIHTLSEILAAGFNALTYTRPMDHADTMVRRLLEEYGPRPRSLGTEYRGAIVGRYYGHHERGGAYELIDIDESGVVLRDTRVFAGTLLVNLAAFLREYLNEDGSAIEEELPEILASEVATIYSESNTVVLVHMPSQTITATDIGLFNTREEAREQALLALRRDLKAWKHPAKTTEIVEAALQRITRQAGITVKQWEYVKAGVRSLTGAINDELAKNK